MVLILVEITFRNSGITASATKADFVVEKLDSDSRNSIIALLDQTPRPGDLYEQVKAKVIDRCSGSEEQRLRCLLQGQVPLDGKPSTILDRMRAMKTGNVQKLF